MGFFTKLRIKSVCEMLSDLEVLNIVLSHWDITGFVEENVRSLEDGVDEETQGDLGQLGGLVFILSELG